MRRLGLALTLVATTLALLQAQTKTDPALDKLAQEFAAAFNAKDAAKVASFYAEDAVLMPANQPMVKGRSGIENFFKTMIAAGVTNLQLKPMESAVAGAHAFDSGTSSVTLGGTTLPGKYVIVLKRVGGAWKIAYDIFNEDVSPPSAEKK
jgi:uncharacterized protein (TIGR02246 family)